MEAPKATFVLFRDEVCMKLSLCSKQCSMGQWIPQKYFQGSRNNSYSYPSSIFLTEIKKKQSVIQMSNQYHLA